MNYYRAFFTLLQDAAHKNFGEAAGRVVLEARGHGGKAAVYIQGISREHIYKLVLISKKGTFAEICSIIPNERGRFESRIDFDRTNIAGSGMACEDADCAAVLAAAGENGAIVAPLAGFKDAPFLFKDTLKQSKREEKPPAPAIEQQAAETPEIGVPPSIEIIEVVEEVPADVYSPETEEQTAASDLFKPQNIIEVFKEQVPGTKWVALNLQDIARLGEKGSQVLASEFVRTRYDKYHHILLGHSLRHTTDHYTLGVPDTFSDEAFTAAQTEGGFATFKRCRDQDPMEGAHGYWLREL